MSNCPKYSIPCNCGPIARATCESLRSDDIGKIVEEKSDDVVLDPKDEFDAVIIDIINTNRSKRHDYAGDEDIFSNFYEVADRVGVSPKEVVEVFIETKGTRLKNLMERVKKSPKAQPKNESISDTLLDRAVYSIIAVALDRRK